MIKVKLMIFIYGNLRVREETDGDVWMLFKGSQPPQNWTDDVKFSGPAHLKPRAGIPFEVAFRSLQYSIEPSDWTSAAPRAQ